VKLNVHQVNAIHPHILKDVKHINQKHNAMYVNIIMLKKMLYASFNQTQYQNVVYNSTSMDNAKNVQ